MTTNDVAFYSCLLGPMVGMLAISTGLLIRDVRRARVAQRAEWLQARVSLWGRGKTVSL